MYGYRKERGWSGRTYYVQMSEKERRESERLKMILCVPTVMTVMAVIMCVCAGIIR